MKTAFICCIVNLQILHCLLLMGPFVLQSILPYRPFFRRPFFNAGPFNAGPFNAGPNYAVFENWSYTYKGWRQKGPPLQIFQKFKIRVVE